MTLIGLCLQHRWFLATDQRDKIYAYLRFCSDSLAEANYHLIVEEVYQRLTISYMIGDQRIDAICAPGNPMAGRNDSLPFWVPDYNATTAALDLNRLRFEACGDKYEAAGKSKWITAFSGDSSRHKVEGIVVDTITAIGMIFEPDLAESHRRPWNCSADPL